jgi:hypothetical protein
VCTARRSAWRWESPSLFSAPERAGHLGLLFPGVGSSAANLLSLGEYIAELHRFAMIVSVDALHLLPFGGGRE